VKETDHECLFGSYELGQAPVALIIIVDLTRLYMVDDQLFSALPIKIVSLL